MKKIVNQIKDLLIRRSFKKDILYEKEWDLPLDVITEIRKVYVTIWEKRTKLIYIIFIGLALLGGYFAFTSNETLINSISGAIILLIGLVLLWHLFFFVIKKTNFTSHKHAILRKYDGEIYEFILDGNKNSSYELRGSKLLKKIGTYSILEVSTTMGNIHVGVPNELAKEIIEIK